MIFIVNLCWRGGKYFFRVEVIFFLGGGCLIRTCDQMSNMSKMTLKFIRLCIGFRLVDFICLPFNSKYRYLTFFCIFLKTSPIAVTHDTGPKEIWDDFMNGLSYLREPAVFSHKLLAVLNIRDFKSDIKKIKSYICMSYITKCDF